MMRLNKAFFLFFLFLLSISSSLAYIDPGTAGMIITNSVWPFIVGIFAAIGGFFIKFFKPIKKGVIGLWGKLRRKQ